MPPPDPAPTADLVVGYVAIERATSVVVVTLRVDEATAAQVLADAAARAGLPVPVACQHVMTALSTVGCDGPITQDALARVLDGIGSGLPGVAVHLRKAHSGSGARSPVAPDRTNDDTLATGDR